MRFAILAVALGLAAQPAMADPPPLPDPETAVAKTMSTLVFCQTLDQFTADLLRVHTPRQVALQVLYDDTLERIQGTLATALAVPPDTIAGLVEQNRSELARDFLTRTEEAGRGGEDSLRAYLRTMVQFKRGCEAILRRAVED